MAHYARVNQNNIVTYVTPIPNEMITDKNGVEHEEWAYKHLYETIPDSLGDRWIQTSYNNNFRNKFAGIENIWREDLNAFISSKPYESWILNEDTCSWNPPVEYPIDNNKYKWNESNQSWDLV
jgi:hypothetical protein